MYMGAAPELRLHRLELEGPFTISGHCQVSLGFSKIYRNGLFKQI